MKILAIDVGIQTLSYCKILKKDDDDFEILDWGILNLHDEKITCCFDTRNKKKCGKTAHFTTNNKEINLCKTHKLKYKLPAVVIDKKDAPINTLCCYETKAKICNKKAKSIINEKHYCSTHCKPIEKTIAKTNDFKPIKNQNANFLPIQYLCVKLCTKLESKRDLLDVDEVVIENQPSKKNATMKTIATFVYNYYCLKGLVEKQTTNSSINSVDFVSPDNKLKIDKNAKRIIGLLKANKTDKYKLTKKFGEEYCKVFINQFPEKIQFLETFAKKDDLCDAFLHGFYWLYKTVPNKYINDIQNVNNKLENDVNNKIIKKNNKTGEDKNEDIEAEE